VARPASRRFRRNRVPHPAARSIADEPHGVDVFERRARRHEHPRTRQRAFRPQDLHRGFDDVGRLGQTALANPPAGQVTLARIDELHAARGQHLEIPDDRGMREHVAVHRRRDHDRRRRRQVERRQKVIGDAVGEFADDIGRRRGDEQQIDGRSQGNVLDVGIRARLPLIGDDLAAGDGLEGQRADEPGGGLRHDGDHVVAVLLQAARDLDGLVGPDAARNAQSDERHDAYARKLLMMSSTAGFMRCVRDRSAAMISCSRTTVGSSSSLTMT
jgi:hypothetical protein